MKYVILAIGLFFISQAWGAKGKGTVVHMAIPPAPPSFQLQKDFKQVKADLKKAEELFAKVRHQLHKIEFNCLKSKE